jgi:hypothetical protein
MDAGDEMLGSTATLMTTMRVPERDAFGTAHQQIGDAMDALNQFEECLDLLERGRYMPNGAAYACWMLDDLEEATHGLRELFAARSP